MRSVLTALAGLAGLMVINAAHAASGNYPIEIADASPAAKAEAAKLDAEKAKPPPGTKINVDHSGRKETGTATYYGPRRGHNHTASGKRLTSSAHIAASKTLPLGTKAEVVNKENGKKTEVVVTDRGPYVKDRVIDVTPKAAEDLGIKKDGVAEVEVKPVEVPKTKEQEKEAVEEVKQQPPAPSPH
jgi:rare lipoprotein A